MRIRVHRTGGVAGVTRDREIDTAHLPAAVAKEIEKLAAAATAHPPAASLAATPDAFTFEVTIDGRRYTAGDGSPAWVRLLERIESSAS